MYQAFESDVMDDLFDAADSPARNYSAQRFDEFDEETYDDYFDKFDGFDADYANEPPSSSSVQNSAQTRIGAMQGRISARRARPYFQQATQILQEASQQSNSSQQDNRFNDFDQFDGFDALEDEDFDAASRGVREQRAQAERQRRRRQQAQQRRTRRQQAQQRSQQAPQPSTSSSASASGHPGVIQSALIRGHQIFHDPRTKAWLQSVGGALGGFPSPTAQTVSQWVGALVDSMPADEFEAENAIDAAAPAIAQVTLRTVMPQVSRLPYSARRQLVRSIADATRLLAQRRGIQAMKAIPRIVQSVQRTARQHRVPFRVLPPVVRRVTVQVAANPTLVRRLSQ